MTYATDRAWSETLVPQVKFLVGPHLLEAAPFDIDQSEATDLIVLRARDMRIAVRIRRFGYFPRYGSQFTIRCRRESGAKTELAKIVEGFGDWLFYGHANDSEDQIEHWMLIDLAAFRAALIRSCMNNNYKVTSGLANNHDGTHFAWFDARSFAWCEPPLLIAASQSVLDLLQEPAA